MNQSYDFMSQYFDWIKSHTVANLLPNGWNEIATPFWGWHTDGIIIEDNKLHLEASIHDYPIKQYFFIQAMLAISGMFPIVAANEKEHYFIDNVVDFFDKNDITYSQDVKFLGKSWLIHSVITRLVS